MRATPIIPGRLYSVTHNGRTHKVIATNAAHAILLDLLRDNALENWKTNLKQELGN